MLKQFEDFHKVVTYLTTVGFDSKIEMEKYLKAHGFGVNFKNFYSDSERNSWMFLVEFRGDKVLSMTVINTMPIGLMKCFDSVSIFPPV